MAYNDPHKGTIGAQSASVSEIRPVGGDAVRAGGQGVVGVSSFRGELCAVKTIPKRRKSAIAAEIASVSVCY